jgi:hypothetical protein
MDVSSQPDAAVRTLFQAPEGFVLLGGSCGGAMRRVVPSGLAISIIVSIRVRRASWLASFVSAVPFNSLIVVLSDVTLSSIRTTVLSPDRMRSVKLTELLFG